MALFKTLKQMSQAMSPEAIKRGLDASRTELTGRSAPPSDEQLVAMPPEERAAYDAAAEQAARGEAEASAAHREHADREVARRALYGPAGEHVYGPLPSAVPQAATIEGSMAASREQLKEVLRNPFGSRKPTPPPGAPTGAVDRDEQAATERAARTAAREPYLAPGRPELVFSRMATRSKTQVEEVAAYLGSSGLSGRADLVLGVYRVPDHIGGGLLRGSRVVEWDIVHVAAPGLPAAAPASAPFFDAEERWVRRRDGERAPLDEDLALAYLVRAGIGPEQCLGIARALRVTTHGGDGANASYTVSQVSGVAVFHPRELGSGVFEQLRRERPLAAEPVTGVHVEVLNWRAIARAVHPETHRRSVIPSPFPDLPNTPQELLRAYLGVVGIRPEDSYGVQVTENRPRDIKGVSQKGPLALSTSRGDEQPCADGELRRRLTAGSRVVLVYRDAPVYVEGRSRWAAYERDVLQAALLHGTNMRPTVERPGILDRGAAGRLWRGAGHVQDLVEGVDTDPFAKIPPHRYCWPLET